MFHASNITEKVTNKIMNNETLFFCSRVTGLGEKIGVTQNNLLLRECVIRNTDFVEGIVVYAGKKWRGTFQLSQVKIISINFTKNQHMYKMIMLVPGHSYLQCI